MEISDELIERVAEYKASPAALDPVRHVPLLFMVGISGAGKDTVLKKLVADHPDKYQFMVSYTTRKPRSNDGVMEKDGVEYHFIDFETAEKMIESHQYIETNYYANNIYGTGIEEVARGGRSGKTVIKDVDVNGVDKYMQLGMNLKPVFLIPPSFEVWMERWTKRHGEDHDPEDKRRRFQTALDELERGLSRDYFYIVVNDDSALTAKRVHDIAQDKVKEHHDSDAIESIKEFIAKIKEALLEY